MRHISRAITRELAERRNQIAMLFARRRAKPRIITAAYSGVCRWCGQRIAVGSVIAWCSGPVKFAIHYDPCLVDAYTEAGELAKEAHP